MAFFPVNTDVVCGTLESTAGTVESLVSADFDVKLMKSEVSIEIDFDDEAAKVSTGDHALDYAIAGAQRGTFKAQHRLAWSGSYATAPASFKFAQACGHTVVEYKRAIGGAAASGQKVVSVSTTGSPFTAGQTVTLKEGGLTENCVIDTVGTNQLTMTANLTNSYTTSGFVHTGISLRPLKAADSTTMTIGAYAIEGADAAPDATLALISGAMGNLEITAEKIGSPLMLSLDFQGKYDSYTDVVNANIPVFSGNCNEICDTLIGSTLTFGGTAQKVSKFSLMSGNGIELLSDQSDDSGYLNAIITKREPKVSFDPIRTYAATSNPIADALAQTSGEIILSTTHFQIRVPKAQAVTPGMSSREGVHSWDRSFNCLRNCTTGGAALDTGLPTECAYEIIMGRRS